MSDVELRYIATVSERCLTEATAWYHSDYKKRPDWIAYSQQDKIHRDRAYHLACVKITDRARDIAYADGWPAEHIGLLLMRPRIVSEYFLKPTDFAVTA